MSLTLFCPLVAVGVLEGLYRVSEERSGFLSVTSSASAFAYAIRYSITSIVLATATLYNLPEYAALKLSPYGRLRDKPGRLLEVFYPNDNGAASVPSEVEHDLIEMSPRIWNDLVLPSVNIVADTASTSTTSDFRINYTVIVPALRPRLDCDVVPAEQKSLVFWEARLQQHNLGEKYLCNIHTPGECRRGTNGDLDYIEFRMANHTVSATTDTLNDVICIRFQLAYLNDLHMHFWDASDLGNRTIVLADDKRVLPSSSTGEGRNNSGYLSPEQPDNLAGCPSLGFMSKISAAS